MKLYALANFDDYYACGPEGDIRFISATWEECVAYREKNPEDFTGDNVQLLELKPGVTGYGVEDPALKVVACYFDLNGDTNEFGDWENPHWYYWHPTYKEWKEMAP